MFWIIGSKDFAIKGMILMKAVIYILSSIVITSIGYFSFVNKKVADVDPSVIEYIEIERNKFIFSISTTGKITSKRTEIVMSENYGIIEDMGYENGDYVKKGTVVGRIRLDEHELEKRQQQLRLAEIDMQILNEKVIQARILYNAKAISGQELKELEKTNYKQSIAVQNIKSEMAPKRVTASFDGVVIQKRFHNLDRVFSGTKLFTLIDAQAQCVEITVFQPDIPKIYMGHKVLFSSNIFKGNRNGKIINMAKTTNQFGEENTNYSSGVSFSVYSTIDCYSDDKILYGSSVQAQIVVDEKENAISVPLEAIVYRGNQKFVFIIENGVAKKRKVIAGGHNDKYIEIITGLSVGDKVIIMGNFEVEEGDELMVNG